MKESRFPELDTLRGLAVLLMVLYHTVFDLHFFYGWSIDIFHGGWMILARTSAVLFLLIAGISFTISWERTPPQHRWKKIAKRFAVLASAAALVSFATWLIAPENFVKFGILHLFALSTLLLPLFAPLKFWNVPIGLLITLTPIVKITNPYALPPTPYSLLVLLGSPPPSFSSLDYFPLIPWFGFVLLGTVLGSSPHFHHALERSQAARAAARPVRIVGQASAVWRSVGRHSLIVYLLHQPLLLALLSLILGRPPPP